MPLYFVSHALSYAVRTGCHSQHIVCRHSKERVHGRTGARDADLGTFSLKKNARPANLILHVKNVCFRADIVSHLTWLEMMPFFQLV